MMRRRQFISLVGGAAAAWPIAARAQQPQGMRRIGVLEGLSAEDQEAQARLSMFAQGLKELGWVEGCWACSSCRAASQIASASEVSRSLRRR
jgi:hypothetical protein